MAAPRSRVRFMSSVKAAEDYSTHPPEWKAWLRRKLCVLGMACVLGLQDGSRRASRGRHGKAGHPKPDVFYRPSSKVLPVTHAGSSIRPTAL